MALNASQTFFVDKGSVQNAPLIGITAVDLYFKQKPARVNNASGIESPGVTVQIVPTSNGVPILDDIGTAPTARAEYGDIRATADASVKTKFRFPAPYHVATDREWAVVINFDGDEDFELWTLKKGDYILDTTQVAAGPSDSRVRNYFTKVVGAAGYPSAAPNSGMMATGSNTTTSTTSSAYTNANWRPLSDVDLKFSVYVARYCFNGNTTFPDTVDTHSPSAGGITRTNGVWEYRLPVSPMEYVLFDRKHSSLGTVFVGERVFQNTVFYSHHKNATPTTVSVSNGAATITAQTGMVWSDLYTPASDQWIVITSENHSGAGLDAVAVRRIKSIVSNTVIQLWETMPFTNSAAKFFKSPVAFVDGVTTIDRFGAVKDLLVLRDSTVNGSVRFVNSTILTVSVNAAGSGYTNSDVLTITGFENVVGAVAGGYAAVGNVVTNATGNIVSVTLSNVGAGFVNTAQCVFTVTNSTSGTVSGGATFAVNTGCVIKTEHLGSTGAAGRFANCEIINLGFGSVTPRLVVTNPSGTVYTAHQRFGYYETSYANASSGKAYYAYPNTAATEVPLVDNVRRKIIASNPPVMPSRSNEWIILFPNGSSSNATSNSTNELAVDVGASNAAVILVRSASNNDFSHVTMSSFYTSLRFSEFVYNNDYTAENTNYGNAWAKEVTSKVNLVGDGAYAEDLVVYVTAHRPVNTDIQVFARIHNSSDSEAFDDKDWTRLEYKGTALHSNPTNEDDMQEFTFGLQAAPNTGTVYAGTLTTTLSSNAIVGSNTSLNTLAAGDLVKIYQPLFPNNYMVSVVGTVTNATHATLVEPVANAGVVGSGLKLEKIAYKHQAFSNKLNQNVARYYTTEMAAVDGFDTMQFKIVLLSSNTLVYPIVDDIRAVAVSS